MHSPVVEGISVFSVFSNDTEVGKCARDAHNLKNRRDDKGRSHAHHGANAQAGTPERARLLPAQNSTSTWLATLLTPLPPLIHVENGGGSPQDRPPG